MDWKISYALKLWTLWRKFTSGGHDTGFTISSAHIWDMKNWKAKPDECTKEIEMNLQLMGMISGEIKTIIPWYVPHDNLLEICYMYREKRYRILYDENITFPPYADVSQTPVFRMFDRDYSSIQVTMTECCDVIEDADSDGEESDVEVEFEEPDLHEIMVELRGPGASLFHQDVQYVVDWKTIRLWIKRFYLNYTELCSIFQDRFCGENNVLVTILWTDDGSETF